MSKLGFQSTNEEKEKEKEKELKNPSKQVVTDLGNGSEVIYIPRFLCWDESWKLLEYLDKNIPWTRPSIHVFGRSCIQPRDTCYVASQGLPELRYSGYQPPVHSWDDYPPLKQILAAVHETLPGSSFNSLLLNRYRSGSDYVAWHSDDEKLYGLTPEIASVSFGCEREFLLRKRPTKTSKVQLRSSTCAEESAIKRLKMSNHDNQHSFLLKHGSLLVMRGYTQRDWVHSVPKRVRADAVRINLTFRRVFEAGGDWNPGGSCHMTILPRHSNYRPRFGIYVQNSNKSMQRSKIGIKHLRKQSSGSPVNSQKKIPRIR